MIRSLNMTGTEHASGNTLAARITKARESVALEQRELAERLEVTPRTVWNYENGHRAPRGFRLRQIARITKKPIEFFTSEDEA